MRKYIAAALAMLCLTGCARTPAGPADTEPSVTAPAATEPTVTQPLATEPSEPEVRDPEPVLTVPPVTEPPATEPPLVGWQEIDGERYYYNEAGTPVTGWLELDGERYYFKENGIMARGKVIFSDDEIRYFTSAGKEIVLVNPWNFVPEDYSVELVEVDGWDVASECAEDLERMLRDCEKAGYSAVIVSAYRTHEYQAGLYQRRIDRFIAQGYDPETAEVEAAKRVAYPGTSEHELGLAVDIVDSAYQKLTEKQETMPAQQWLMENCWKYGFILRYPNDQSDVTGIIYEPWHYRYVGKELAEELHGSGQCLEAYLQALTAADDHN